MTLTAEPATEGPSASPGQDDGRRLTWSLALVVTGLLALIVVLAAINVVQGTAAVGLGDLWAWVTGSADQQVSAVVVDSRLPRVAAALVVGIALGAAGCVLQSISRNVLASPDTLAVNAGAFLALTVAATVGLPGLIFGDLVLAFVGGLAAAGVVFLLAGTDYGTVRLVLAGTVVAMVLMSLATTLIILNPIEGQGLQAWESGMLSQNGLGGVRAMVPVIAAGLLVVLLYGRRLDVMVLGDDAARSVGIPVRQTQLIVLVIAVVLSAAAVTVTGPIGFIGLAAPALTRLAAPHVPGLHRHRALIPVSGLAGVAIVLGADVLIRALLGAQRAVEVPTGVVTSLLGAVVLVWFAFRLRASRLDDASNALDVRGVGTKHPIALMVVLALVLFALVIAAVLVGDRVFLLGDFMNWATGQAGPIVSNVMGARVPRVLAALLAGVALAIAGTAIQAVTRNPLADPTIIGVAGGASVGAVVIVTFVPMASFWVLAGASGVGALIAAAIVFGLAAKGGFATDRLVLIGVGVSFASEALVKLMIVTTDPWNATKALTWLAGSTYGRSYEHLVPLMIALVVLVPAIVCGYRYMDLLSVDEDTPRVLGVRPARARFALLGCAVLLTATAVAAIGLVGFVGLVAPHAARSLVGRRHKLVIPVAALLGAILLVLADMLGRTVAAPTQLSAGLLAALVGAPYFFWLLHRSRRTTAG
ncbi:iron ABC transporter permease [Mumia sp. ZJ1417]|uniref:iron ABC transporter permease n=1 Tax=Mumia sp. ZJ1417 TaxID=2708082 RepID=UPI00142135C5|nr:iron ABC transporter permease [Mumia sp. ZJ1417]QMW66564.1 iron ABC transporter permease [Mumia sp. ZJ1417]